MIKFLSKNSFLIILAVGLTGFIFAIAYLGIGKNQIKQEAVGEHLKHHPELSQKGTSITDLLNKPAPDFSLTDRDGKIYSSENLRGKNVVLFFNEGLMCYPACWIQIAALAKDNDLKNSGAIILSVVVDSKEEWQKAIAQMPELSQAIIVFDKNAAVSSAFNMLKTESSMHYGSLPGHTYIVIDKNGIVRHIFDDSNMALHNSQLLEELKKLN